MLTANAVFFIILCPCFLMELLAMGLCKVTERSDERKTWLATVPETVDSI